MRLFIGIPLAAEVVDALERISRSLRSANDNLRWTSPETWHITLQFLGETSIEKYRCVVQHLSEIKAPAVPVWLHGTGFFDRAGVFFAAVNVSPELRGLERLVVQLQHSAGSMQKTGPITRTSRSHAPKAKKRARTSQAQKPGEKRLGIPVVHCARIPALRVLPPFRWRASRSARSLPPRLIADPHREKKPGLKPVHDIWREDPEDKRRLQDFWDRNAVEEGIAIALVQGVRPYAGVRQSAGRNGDCRGAHPR